MNLVHFHPPVDRARTDPAEGGRFIDEGCSILQGTLPVNPSGGLLACGHPITQYGMVEMPMTKANVVATLASPLNAFKIINTTLTPNQSFGLVTQSRENGWRQIQYGIKFSF